MHVAWQRNSLQLSAHNSLYPEREGLPLLLLNSHLRFARNLIIIAPDASDDDGPRIKIKGLVD